jgi:hypothetical protein
MILSTARQLIGLALAAALLPINARAQTVVFPDLASHIKLCDSVSLIDSDGGRVEGAVADVTTASRTLLLNDAKTVFPEATVSGRFINDPVWEGALIGLAVGAVAGAMLGRLSCADSGTCTSGPIVLGALLGGLGAWIGARIDGLISIRVPYRLGASLKVSPIVAPNPQGIRMSIRF